jgi:hypothetical protein
MPAGAGLVLSVRGEPRFLPALLVHSVSSCPRLSRVPGSPLGMAWVGGKVIPVARIGDQGSHLVVCLTGGEVVGLSGVEVQKTGFFDPSGDGVLCEGQTVRPLDVARELELAASGVA